MGAYCEFSKSSLISSTFVFDAASTSIRSTKFPLSTEIQEEHSPHGFDEMPFSQLSDFAKILANVVLPTPRVPVNK